MHDLCCETVCRVLWPKKRVNVTENQIHKSLMKSPFTFDLFPDRITASVRWEIQDPACFAVFTVFLFALEVSQFVMYLVWAHMDARLEQRHYF